jgi:hypothetical protein
MPLERAHRAPTAFKRGEPIDSLLIPVDWKWLQQCWQPQRLRLPPIYDRLDDIGRQQGQSQNTVHVASLDLLRARNPEHADLHRTSEPVVSTSGATPAGFLPKPRRSARTGNIASRGR